VQICAAAFFLTLRLNLWLVSAFAFVALVLTAAGLYGVMAYLVAPPSRFLRRAPRASIPSRLSESRKFGKLPSQSLHHGGRGRQSVGKQTHSIE